VHTGRKSSICPKWPGQSSIFDALPAYVQSQVLHLIEKSFVPILGSFTLPYTGSPFLCRSIFVIPALTSSSLLSFIFCVTDPFFYSQKNWRKLEIAFHKLLVVQKINSLSHLEKIFRTGLCPLRECDILNA